MDREGKMLWLVDESRNKNLGLTVHLKFSYRHGIRDFKGIYNIYEKKTLTFLVVMLKKHWRWLLPLAIFKVRSLEKTIGTKSSKKLRENLDLVMVFILNLIEKHYYK